MKSSAAKRSSLVNDARRRFLTLRVFRDEDFMAHARVF